MMTTNQLTRLAIAAQEWMGTPFARYQCCVGIGVDCVQLAGALMVAAGVLDKQPDFGAYTVDLASHTGREMITEWLEGASVFGRVLYPQAGDVVTFRIGKAVNHVGVMISARDFVHALQGGGVCESTLDDATWGSRIANYWRAV